MVASFGGVGLPVPMAEETCHRGILLRVLPLQHGQWMKGLSEEKRSAELSIA